MSFQKGTGRGPGRPRKVRPVEENVTIAADTPPNIPNNNSSLSFTGADDSILSIDSACPSPQSTVSICSFEHVCNAEQGLCLGMNGTTSRDIKRSSAQELHQQFCNVAAERRQR